MKSSAEPYYIFDVFQLEEYGYNFYSGKGFNCRFKVHTRFNGVWRSVLIPLGPIAYTKEGFENFLSYWFVQNYNKIILPLPLILDEQNIAEIDNFLVSYGFHKEEYQIFEDETLIVKKKDYSLDKDVRYEVRYGKKRLDIICKYDPDIEFLKDAYKVYEESGKRIGFSPKSFEIFSTLAKRSLLAVAYPKLEYGIVEEPAGFVLGYIYDTYSKGYSDNAISKLMQTVFAGSSEKGMELNSGAVLYDTIIKTAFETRGVDIVDLYGASRKRDPSYLTFKKKFGKDFVKRPGRYVYTNMFNSIMRFL